MGKNPEVLPHFPPQYILSKSHESRELLSKDDADGKVTVNVHEHDCEYAISNPTGLFNLTIPKMETKVISFKTISYGEHKFDL